MRRLSPARFDVALTCGFVLVALLEAWLSAGDDDPLVFLLASAAILPLPLLVRRKRPILAVCGVLAVMVLQRVVLGEIWDAGSSLAVPMCAVFSAGAYLPRALGATATAGVIVTTSIADIGEDGSDWPFLTLVFGAMWAAGLAARRYRELAERTAAYAEELRSLQAEREELAVRAERTRIARELHDVVAHCVSTIVVQAEAGQALIERDPPRATESFVAIQDTGRQALVELRRLLGLLRSHDSGEHEPPQPSLGNLEALVEEVRRTGLSVDLEIEGDRRALPHGVDLSAYRIVQESLTNTIKHADARRARVALRFEADDLSIEVEDDGVAAPVPRPGGHGLRGMAERARLLGGTVETGRAPQGGYAVRAKLPLA